MRPLRWPHLFQAYCMRLCYVDEAGCTGTLPSPTSPIQPVFVLIALAFDSTALPDLTREYLAIKQRFYPKANTTGHHLDMVLSEIKGGELRKKATIGNSRERRHAIGVYDKTLDLIERFGGEVFGRVWVKGIGVPVNGRSVYTYSIQDIFATFQEFLVSRPREESGIVIADSRNKAKNAQVSHSVFTRKFAAAGDAFSRIVEMPTFGHSDNHVGLQLADFVCSALVFPFAVHTYCTGQVSNLHVRPQYQALKSRYAQRLKNLQFRYRDASGRWRGGITVSDVLGHRSGAHLFI